MGVRKEESTSMPPPRMFVGYMPPPGVVAENMLRPVMFAGNSRLSASMPPPGMFAGNMPPPGVVDWSSTLSTSMPPGMFAENVPPAGMFAGNSRLSAGNGATVNRINWDADWASQQIEAFNAQFDNLVPKIHRFPPSLGPLRTQYGIPPNVPIGPYQDFSKVNATDTPKLVATVCFVRNTIFHSFEDMYEAFCSTIDVRRFCCEDVPEDDGQFMIQMLFDGCFLLQYMDTFTSRTVSQRLLPGLVNYFHSNQVIIDRDIMLLENQLPWVVIETLRSYQRVPVKVEEFAAKMARTLQQVRKGNDDKGYEPDGRNYMPPHLLGLVRFYKIGGESVTMEQNKRLPWINYYYCCYNSSGSTRSDGTRAICKSVSSIELAEIGIKVSVSKTTDFTDLGIKKCFFCTEIFLPPLLLDETRLCWLINMVAFELCISTADRSNTDNMDVVSSYLFILAMLMDREDDVHKLRSRGIVQGELTNKETLDFFKGLVKHISGGHLYRHLMEEIEDYKLKRWMWIKLHKFFYKNYKTIAAVVSIVGVLVGIFKALFALKQH